MKAKVILVVTNPCLSDPRVEFCAETLAGMGLTAEILAWDRTGDAPPYEIRENYAIRRITVKSGFNQKLRQVIPIIRFYLSAYRYLRQQDDCVIVHCNDFDTLPLGLLLKRTRPVKVVYDAHEIYCDMVFDKYPFLRGLCLRWERRLIQRADLFFTVGEVRKTWYAGHGYRRTPVVLGNWKHRPEISFDRDLERAKRGLAEKIVILYIGVFSPERNLEELIRAVNGDERFHFILGGYGLQQERIEAMIKGSANIEYIGFVKDKKVMDYYNTLCDVIYYGLTADSPVSPTAVPNKMFEAIAFEKIFLTSPFGEMLELDRNGRTFLFIHDLRQQLNELTEIMGDPEKRRVITAHNNALYRKYRQENAVRILTAQYAGLIPKDMSKQTDISKKVIRIKAKVM